MLFAVLAGFVGYLASSIACRGSTTRSTNAPSMRRAMRDGWCRRDPHRRLRRIALARAMLDGLHRRADRGDTAMTRASCCSRVWCARRLRRHEQSGQAEGLFAALSVRPRSRPAPWSIRTSRCGRRRVTLALLAARPGALPHLLHALPFGAGRRPRHGRAARLSAAAVLSHRPAAPGAGAAFLRRDHATATARCIRLPIACSRRTAGRSPAYIRALQRSQNATVADVPPDQRGALQ